MKNSLEKNNNGYNVFFEVVLNKDISDKYIKKMLSTIYGYENDDYIKYCQDESDLILKNNDTWCYRATENTDLRKVYNIIYKQGFKIKKINNKKVRDGRDNLNHLKNIITNMPGNEKVEKSNFKKKYFTDYSICHIYDATRNPLLYILPWNYFFVPRPIESLTDTNSTYLKENKDDDSILLHQLKIFIIEKFKTQIEQYNNIIKNIFKTLKKDKEFIENFKNLNYKNQLTISKQFYWIDLDNNGNKEYLLDELIKKQ